ncbi:hypothetical protein KL938_004345 [Ogataea parapolymorpha]|nr:hypothetical protein KL938_004345 [Ogataea parapolymorpha]
MSVFCSLGMFILDEIYFADGTSLYNVLGGGGVFAMVGSRIVLGSQQSRLCGGIIDIGSDCPEEILRELQSWNLGAVFRYDNTRLCTRGWNKYGLNDWREFKYMTPKRRIEVADLKQHEHLIRSRSFHLLCSPGSLREMLQSIISARPDKPLIVYEAIPDRCRPEHLEALNAALEHVDVFSPNAAEAAAFFGEPEPTDKETCERVARMHKARVLLVRCGALGSLLFANGQIKWFPAYHDDPARSDYKVVDPTGCGNTFVGAFATQLALSGDLEEACISATVASGLAIEQYGPPRLEDADRWNGTFFEQRVQNYRNRLVAPNQPA